MDIGPCKSTSSIQPYQVFRDVLIQVLTVIQTPAPSLFFLVFSSLFPLSSGLAFLFFQIGPGNFRFTFYHFPNFKESYFIPIVLVKGIELTLIGWSCSTNFNVIGQPGCVSILGITSTTISSWTESEQAGSSKWNQGILPKKWDRILSRHRWRDNHTPSLLCVRLPPSPGLLLRPQFVLLPQFPHSMQTWSVCNNY